MQTIGAKMTPIPVTIPHDLSMADAAQRMFDHRVRHLPVVAGEEVVGIITERDVALVDSIDGLDREAVTVSQAMTADPYSAPADTPLKDVLEAMIDRKYGAVIVEAEGKPIGIFTAVDALKALRDTLDD